MTEEQMKAGVKAALMIGSFQMAHEIALDYYMELYWTLPPGNWREIFSSAEPEKPQ